jgi:hypothetical protein
MEIKFMIGRYRDEQTYRRLRFSTKDSGRGE